MHALLLSRTKSKEFWEKFNWIMIEHKWAENPECVAHFNSVNFGLTKRIINLLYGHGYGTLKVEITFPYGFNFFLLSHVLICIDIVAKKW